VSHYHAVVWLDHREAHVLHIARDDVEALRVRAKGSGHLLEHAKHIHHRAGTRTGNHAPDNPIYFDDVIAALGDAQDWLIVGPGTAKQDFLRHLKTHRPNLRARVVGVESSDHPTDKQIAADARRYFLGSDRLRPPLGA
jgi:stalled ribosome rescue protein Dom34